MPYLARDLLEEVPVVSLEHSIQDVCESIEGLCMCDLPVLKGKNLVGILPGEYFIGVEGDELNRKVSDFRENFYHLFVNSEQHLLDVVYIAGLQKSGIIPVVDDNNIYIGCIKIRNLISTLANVYSFTQPGGLITLTLESRDFQLSELSRIAEAENANILSVFTNFSEDGSTVNVTLKLNQKDLNSIAATFERMGYQTRLYHQDRFEFRDLRDRYEYLMKFIDM